ncbi:MULTISPECIES: GxxExxY protein [Aerosakkonema]|uniref:GxxExxY protein n=1 Tax=Aerosakkonema TaxID=1246629 RepID=UPI0035B9342B
MNADERRWEINQITDKIIGCAFKVSNTLGCGFLEKVYENALVYEVRKTGLRVHPQYPIAVYYDGVVVGEFAADLLVEGRVLVELKAIKTMTEKDTSQCLNYLKATNLTICLLINFGNPEVEIRRIVRNF